MVFTINTIFIVKGLYNTTSPVYRWFTKIAVNIAEKNLEKTINRCDLTPFIAQPYVNGELGNFANRKRLKIRLMPKSIVKYRPLTSLKESRTNFCLLEIIDDSLVGN